MNHAPSTPARSAPPSHPAPPPINGTLEHLLSAIGSHLEAVERRLARELRSHWTDVDQILQYGYVLGGKRLRPALLILSGQACGTVDARHELLGTVIEMIHTATLVHDDVLDSSQRRRHRPTVNARWGNHTSVLLGDYLFTHAFYLASTLETTEACRWIGQATNRVCEGELRQARHQGRWDIAEQDYLAMIDGKTAALTECACRLGAWMSGSGPEVVGRLGTYGRLLGRAFQITDDLLDLCGQEHLTGKTLGSDLRDRKATLPVVRLVQQLDADQRARFGRLWEDGQFEQLRAWLGQTDAMAYTRAAAARFARQAAQQLEPLPASPARDHLRQLVELMLLRVA